MNWLNYYSGTEHGRTTDCASNDFYHCGHCGMYHSGTCSKIKAIEYHPDGTVKRVEYHGAAPQMPFGTIR